MHDDHMYLIALGSNQRHTLIGRPELILTEALCALEMEDINVFAASATFGSRPLGPSLRNYANSAAILVTKLDPPDLMDRLHAIEAHFGRKRRGMRWRSRVLDLDIILWSGGIWADDFPALSIPHPALRFRSFVLTPAAMIAPDWRDPVTGLTIRQLQSRLTRPKPLDAYR